MNSRRETGYQVDLEHLARLRRATFGDERITSEQYEKMCAAILVIENTLRPLAKRHK